MFSYPDLYDVISVWREKIEGNFESETLKRSFDMPLYSVCVAIIVLRRNADVQAIIEMLKHLSSYFSKVSYCQNLITTLVLSLIKIF